jgi:hypothetical protein
MSMAATKISRFFVIFTALALLDKIAGYQPSKRNKNDNRPIDQAGAHQRPQQLPIKRAHTEG